jgi:hypothetical protein
MLPEPALTLTLPSLHDDTPLDCRVYHPLSLNPSPTSPPWRKHVAVVAHPYAPLGGCYDDPIVDVIATTLLRLGYLVGTFNFRFVFWGAKLPRFGTNKGLLEALPDLPDEHHGPQKLNAPIIRR